MTKATQVYSKNPHYLRWAMASLSVLTLATGFQLAHADEPKRILKWKDDKGVTQYGDKIPPQYSNRENSVINQQGITVKRNKPFVYQDQAAEQAQQDQVKKDRALLNAFTHEDEIDLARDRHLQLDKVTLQSLEMQKVNNQKRLMSSQHYADTYTKQKKKVPVDVAADIKTTQDELAALDKQINTRKTIMEDTRKRFEEDKKRYMELKYPDNASAPAVTAPTAQPN